MHNGGGFVYNADEDIRTFNLIIYRDRSDKFRWKIQEMYGIIVGMSAMSFDTQKACEDNFDLVRQAKIR